MDFPAHEPIFEIPFPIDQESVNYIKIEMGPSSTVIFYQMVILTPKYCAIFILSCDNISPTVPVIPRPQCERCYLYA